MIELLAAAALAVHGPPDVQPTPREVQEEDYNFPRERYYIDPHETLADAAARYRRLRANARRWEAAYQVLSAIDAAQTIDCLNRNVCAEGNPLFGRNPSTGKLIGIKAFTGIIHYLIFEGKLRKDPEEARTFARTSVFVQGAIVGANLRFSF